MDASDVKRWVRARGLASQLKQENFARTRISAADAFAAACGLMDLASRFRQSTDGPDLMRQRDERDTHVAWQRLRERYLLKLR